MDDFWARRKRAKKLEKLAGFYLVLGLSLLLFGLYLLIRKGVTTGILDRSVPLSQEELVAVFILMASFTWIFIRTLEQNATSLIVAGLKARPLRHERPDEASLQDLIDQLGDQIGVVRLEVLICDTSAINFIALRSFEGRNIIFITEGALNRLDGRLLKAGLAQSMARLNQPEVIAWSRYCFLFATLHQLKLGLRNVEKRSKVNAIAKFRFLGSFFSLFGLPLRLTMDVSSNVLADKDAIRVTRDPIAQVDIVSRLQTQWTGAGVLSPTLCLAAISDVRWTDWIGGGPGSQLSQSSEQISPIVRMSKILSQMQMSVSHLFKAARANASVVQKDDDSSEVLFRAIRKGAVEGPYKTEEVQGLSWMNARALVQMGNGGAPGLAFEFASLRRLFFGRYRPCPRCGVSLTSFVHQKHELNRCMKCHGILCNTDLLPDMGAVKLSGGAGEKGFTPSAKKLENFASKFLKRESSEFCRAFCEAKCPECRKPMDVKALQFKGSPVVLNCTPCKNAWFDAEELPALLEKMDRFISWDRVLDGESDALLPAKAYDQLSSEEQAKIAGVKISNRKLSDFLPQEGASAAPKEVKKPSSEPKVEKEPPKKKGLIRGAFVPRNAEDVKKERTLKARRERFRMEKSKKDKE